MGIYEIFTSFLGNPPAGYEPLVYVFALLVGYKTIEMLIDLFRKVGGFLN